MSDSGDAYDLGYAQHKASDEYEDVAQRARNLYPNSTDLREWYIEGFETARAEFNHYIQHMGEP